MERQSESPSSSQRRHGSQKTGWLFPHPPKKKAIPVGPSVLGHSLERITGSSKKTSPLGWKILCGTTTMGIRDLPVSMVFTWIKWKGFYC